MQQELFDGNKYEKAKPIVKWAGGKRQMLEVLNENRPRSFNKYIEPFVGGGALFFDLEPEEAIISDVNPELINLYRVVVENVEGLIEKLSLMKNEEEYYYKVRALVPEELSKLDRAARMLYLNKTCFNGLYRVNKKNEFNVPFGRYKNPKICDEENLRRASRALQKATILEASYEEVLNKYAEPGDFIFIDPPYVPISKYSDFKRYTKDQFGLQDQERLSKLTHELYEKGCSVLLTNSNHPLVHELYEPFEIEVHETRRSINSVSNKRTGQDVLIKAIPNKKEVEQQDSFQNQVALFPSTRFMGSKEKLLDHLVETVSRFQYNSVLDLFSGSGVVSYLFKSLGKEVYSNDYMAFSSNITKSLVENQKIILSDMDIEKVIVENDGGDNFVSNNFKGIYYSDEDNLFLDRVRKNVKKIHDPFKKSLIYASLVRACLKKRPRGIFTYTGYRYDDGRRDLKLTLEEHFLEAVEEYNAAVFDNNKNNKSFNENALELAVEADLVYMDPPYYSPLSDNEYVRRYHFVEGLVRDWEGVEMQWETKTKKFKNYPTPFSKKNETYEAFEYLFEKYKDSIIVVSYSSNALPTKEEMVQMMKEHKENVEVIEIDYRYSFGNQSKESKNKVQEYLFVGY